MIVPFVSVSLTLDCATETVQPVSRLDVEGGYIPLHRSHRFFFSVSFAAQPCLETLRDVRNWIHHLALQSTLASIPHVHLRHGTIRYCT